VKALLKPFGAPPKDTDDNGNDEENDGGPEIVEEVEDDIEDEDEDRDVADDEGQGVEDGDEEEDPFDALDEEERTKLLENTLAVRSTLNKVFTCFLTNFSSFYSHLFSKDPKTFFCNHPLDNKSPSRLAQGLHRS
jgi:hypothetical protein